jgi:hypothetical protein
MDDFMLDNVRVPEIAEAAQEAFERIIRGRPLTDSDRPDWRAYERAQRRARETAGQPPRARHLHGVAAGDSRESRV